MKIVHLMVLCDVEERRARRIPLKGPLLSVLVALQIFHARTNRASFERNLKNAEKIH